MGYSIEYFVHPPWASTTLPILFGMDVTTLMMFHDTEKYGHVIILNNVASNTQTRDYNDSNNANCLGNSNNM